MSFGGESNTKGIVKKLVLKNKDYILEKLKKEGNTPETLEKIKQEFIMLASKDIIGNYEKSIEAKKQKIKEIENEIKKFYDDLNTQIAAERSIYGEEILDSIKKYFELLQKEENEFENYKVEIQGIKEKISNINKMLSENESQMADSLNHIKNIEKRYKTSINQSLKKLSDKLNSFGDREKEKVAQLIQESYDKYSKHLKEKFEKLNKQLEEDYETSKKDLKQKLFNIFSKEKLQINKEKKELLKELLYFDGYTFIKVFFILGFVLLIILLDYFLMRDIIKQYFDIDSYSDSHFRIFLYTYVVPFIFSGGIILSEIINDKVVKYHNKKMYWVLKLLAYIAILGVIFSVVLTADGVSFEITALPEIVIRLILFGMSIPAAVILVEKFISLYDILDFIKMTILLPFKILLAPFVYIMYLLEIGKLNKIKENSIQQLNQAKINLSTNFDIQPLTIDLGKLIKFKQFDEGDYNFIFSDDLENNLKHILHSLNQINNTINNIGVVVSKGDEIVKQRLKIVINLLEELDTKLMKKIQVFEKQYQPLIDDFKKQIREINKDIEKDEEQYNQLLKETTEGIIEGLSEIK